MSRQHVDPAIDTAQSSSDRLDPASAPMRIGRARLRVRDPEGTSAFYRNALGLAPLRSGEGAVVLGTPGRPLVELVGDPAAAPNRTEAAGLFHTAFLLPYRADLARWLVHAASSGLPVSGASDHNVSEAIYLADPEGNGVEVYADRPPSRWTGDDGHVVMHTDPLDIRDLRAAAGDGEWSGMPEGGAIGHVHLQVGDTGQAERFYGGILGFDVTCRYPGGTFFGSGGYHHHLAANTWRSGGAGPRPAGMAGLEDVEIVVRDPGRVAAVAQRATQAGIPVDNIENGIRLRDPWALSIRLVAG